MAGSITDQDRDFVETWEHISPQRWGILRLDARGDEKSEVITGRRHFKITTEERILTQDKIARPENDPFLNGSFRPVVVPDSVTIETNPNALSDEEIEKILKSSDIAWEENLKLINSVATYRRMLEIAEEMDSVSLKRYRTLEQRLLAVREQARVTSKDPEIQKFLNGGRDDAPKRGRGGMSDTYR